MTLRKIISLSIAWSFILLTVTGILSYFNAYSRTVATLHTVFGVVFILGVVFHINNNIRSLKMYSKGRIIGIVSLVGIMLSIAAYYQTEPFHTFMNYSAELKSKDHQELNLNQYEIIKMNTQNQVQLSIDVLRGEHYWHPQMAIWVEDTHGNYLETLFVSKATAKGLFFGGRSKDNFKTFDAAEDANGTYRRVNALPIWSHQRGVQYEDGLFVPSSTDDFPDAITGATIKDNFKLLTSISENPKFRLKIELNVAFDDNEFYSEFDFPDDAIFHSGTGQLGQPSILYETLINLDDDIHYYLMELIGHGHQSGQSGQIYKDLSKLTTAKQIVERIVIGVHRTPS